MGETFIEISAKKAPLIGGGALVGIVIVVAIVVLAGLDDIVKVSIEPAGTKVTKVEVVLYDVDVLPTKGQCCAARADSGQSARL